MLAGLLRPRAGTAGVSEGIGHNDVGSALSFAGSCGGEAFNANPTKRRTASDRFGRSSCWRRHLSMALNASSLNPISTFVGNCSGFDIACPNISFGSEDISHILKAQAGQAKATTPSREWLARCRPADRLTRKIDLHFIGKLVSATGPRVFPSSVMIMRKSETSDLRAQARGRHILLLERAHHRLACLRGRNVNGARYHRMVFLR